MTDLRPPVPALHAMRWRIAILLCLVTAISYVDRQALSVAAPVVRDEFHLTNTQYGWIAYAFLMAYALGQLVLGPLIDRLGTRRSFTLAVVWWSVAAMLHALGRGFVSFFALRALLGVTEAVNFPAALKAVAEWFPKHERSLATGIVTAGTGIGAIVAPPLVGLLIHFYGWQAAFLVPGAVGFLWVIAWKRWFHPPEIHPTITPAERVVHPRRPGCALEREAGRSLARLPAPSRNLGPDPRALHRGRGVLFLRVLAAELPAQRARLRHREDRLGRGAAIRGGRPRRAVRRMAGRAT